MSSEASDGTVVVDPPSGPMVAISPADDPYLIEVVAPIESVTKDATLDEIRGDVPADRNTLALLSAALDQQAVDLRAYARRVARRYAVALG